MRAGAGSERGFTLVELLLAVSLMSVLLALAYGGFRAAAQASISGQAQLEETSRLRITQQFLRRQFNQMLPLAYLTESGEAAQQAMFMGNGTRMQFVATMPGYLGSGGPQVQALELVPAAEGVELQFRHALWQDFDPAYLYEGEPVVLLKGLADARFEFLAPNDQGQAAAWVADWEEPEIMPLGVRLAVKFGDGSRVIWPQLSAGIRMDATAVHPGNGSRDYSEAIKDLMRKRDERESQ